MRYLVTGRTSTPVEVWRTMATSLGAWALRGYGIWACEKIDDGAFVGTVGIFQPLDWPEPEIAYSLDRPFWRQGFATERRRPLATGCSSTFPCRGLRASSGRIIMHRSTSRNGSAQSANAHSSCVARSLNIGCTTAGGGTRNCPLSAVTPRLPRPGTILDQPN
jgi:hypothetical protein